ncbi:MAG: ABC transporter ATP-binding protein [Phycisphaeraceae bacterium]|nr:ABC transporter ATP-binding protein [Phycisphaeraceae bacterium]
MSGPGTNGAAGAPLLSIEGLSAGFDGQSAPAVQGLTLSVKAGEIVALVGESGSGKSVTALSLLRLLPRSAWISGRAEFVRESGEVVDLYSAPMGTMLSLRGADISMIFQEPMTSLNPVFTIGEQLTEGLRLNGATRGEARERGERALAEVGISEPGRRFSQYPHEFSGGMRQRVMIAMALLRSPRLLIADEPTTALDVTVQAQVLDLLASLRAARGLSILLITHDLGLVSRVADVAAVMFRGRLVEVGPVSEVFARPAHPYTRALLACAPRLGAPRKRLMSIADILAAGGGPFGRTGRSPWMPPVDGDSARGDGCVLEPVGPGHSVAVVEPGEIAAGAEPAT